ncbi:MULTISPECIES: SMU1112c/YaeR family gloxylase I-like metalloprotein [Butyrivibrio]|jgi:glyoxylase I family protein|uniref:Glyoxylase I family protein n=1 Tax=Butyrivibrio fibrisolvens DSM 3071 TaxID=1121131 RepID=A0A1M5PV70_BUTFI|nr:MULTISPECIES: VOC family protein [Butyrivibrio]MBE5845582.1 VOC family protein [Butyrivibrio sp.]MBQ3796548.1 VOC family protein [Butyrivibrio sp.]SHH05173.1 glyoxylase I family protein [Butyrivibrio fibrisolvens DSM 3071]
MKLNRIHHIAVICSDKDTALNFYHNKLGFRILRENYRPERDDWKIDLKLDDSEIELFIMKDHPLRPSPEAYGLRHLAFRVDSVDETVAELESMGIPCEPIRRDAFTGEKMTFFRDPDGLPLEIHE